MGKQPVRILQMIGSLEVGGSQAMILNLYRAIDRAKVQFDFVVDHPDKMDLAPEVRALGAKIYFMPTFRGTNILQVLYAWNKFFAEHPEYKVLHTHVRSYASVYLPIAKKHGVTTIAHSHSTSNGKGIKATVKNLMQLPIRKQADYLFACSQEAGEWLYGKRACKQSNFRIIPNAIDFQKFAFDPEKRAEMRKRLNLQDQFVIGHVGRFVEPKNHDFLIDVFSEYHKSSPNSRLLLVGDGPLMSQIIQKCRTLNISDKVLFVGAQKNAADYYQAMDVFVFPSKWEGMPLTIVEAQVNGVPLLISDNVSKEAIASKQIKRLSIQDNNLWCNELIKLNNNYQKVEKRFVFSNQNGNHIFSLYDITKSANKLQDIYLQI